MKFSKRKIFAISLGLICVFCAGAARALTLDREAFTFTNYDLSVQLDPEQHRLGVRGKIMLRNDSQTPQQIAVLQISSSLDWRSIKADDKAVQFVRQPFTSDIDHTGGLSEAIVTLPRAVAPKGTIELEIAYEGVILLDATRLTRIGTPADAAQSTDWDQVGADFTAVRGAGYVAWYPIATEVANLSEGDSLFEVLGRWKARESESKMKIAMSYSTLPSDASVPVVLCSGKRLQVVTRGGSPKLPSLECSYEPMGTETPSFVIGDYAVVDRPDITVYYMSGHADPAETYADEAEKLIPFITDWFGKISHKATTAELPDPSAAPFESGSFLLTPMASTNARLDGLAAAHQLTHAAFSSFRPWIEEGLAHFAQALYLNRQSGRRAALDYMGLHRSAFSALETQAATPKPEDALNRALVNTISEELYRSKAMYVWWMLRDMLGDAALKKAFAAYRPEQDKDPSYMPRLIQAQTARDLEWFFDDWVYRDRGLPDFKVETAFSSKMMTGSYMVAVTVDNLGAAGAEVPVTVKFAGGDETKRLEVRGKNKAVIRIEVPQAPQEIVVNDGSVPESDVTNNVFKIAGNAGSN